MKGSIELTGMEFHAFHGCLPEERQKGNRFTVDFRCCCDLGKAATSDRLEDTVDYGAVYDIVATQMAVPSNILEHVAGRILRAIGEAFPELDEFSISVAKSNPPVNGPAAISRVTLYHKKNEL